MRELGHGLDAIGITGYPESHPFIADDETIEAMFAKERFASYIVSQIAFDASVIASWIDRVRRRGTYLPIHIGLAGPVDRHKLVRISTRIGVGESLRFVRGHRDWAARLFLPGAFSPDRLLAQLGPSFADREQRVVGIHVYTFNAVAETERWRREAIERLSA
jgi:methylenetetrahydrofolate reductase (NADPH)